VSLFGVKNNFVCYQNPGKQSDHGYLFENWNNKSICARVTIPWYDVTDWKVTGRKMFEGQSNSENHITHG
jgi:hypothetical protein